MRYAIHIIIAAGLIGGATGCAELAESSRQVARGIDDANINSDVLDAFATDPAKIAFTDIDVNTEAGVVYLTGTVVNAPSEQYAISVASNVRGVRQVVSELRIVEAAAPAGDSQRDVDAQITDAVRQRFANDRSRDALANINVSTSRGTVRLTGVVPDATAQQRAGDLARGVADVRRVVNDLQVRASRVNPPATNAEQDAAITEQVRRALTAGRNRNFANVGVRTANKTVYLSGFVKNSARKDRAAQLANGVDGVRRVVNNLQTTDNESSSR